MTASARGSRNPRKIGTRHMPNMHARAFTCTIVVEIVSIAANQEMIGSLIYKKLSGNKFLTCRLFGGDDGRFAGNEHLDYFGADHEHAFAAVDASPANRSLPSYDAEQEILESFNLGPHYWRRRGSVTACWLNKPLATAFGAASARMSPEG
ncbi:hypothetical protein CC78DRAFT_580435 [Lojkania enalia]|uniref:Uncharacterized protein n=1 Tax=Lojkania enalia TaxID=147567 RepID=A0A9P4K9T3_9PLEO|nr:hypothetical protein CC78DRAFT_580435 [Didymosphaeria enalia]